jgi:hypothetical protein
LRLGEGVRETINEYLWRQLHILILRLFSTDNGFFEEGRRLILRFITSLDEPLHLVLDLLGHGFFKDGVLYPVSIV